MRIVDDMFDTAGDDGAPFITQTDALGLYRPDEAAAAARWTSTDGGDPALDD